MIQSLAERAETLLRQKYVTRADERQKQIGLSYVEAETKDLAKTLAEFAAKEGGIMECPTCHGVGGECEECNGTGGVQL